MADIRNKLAVGSLAGDDVREALSMLINSPGFRMMQPAREKAALSTQPTQPQQR